MIFFLNIGPF